MRPVAALLAPALLSVAALAAPAVAQTKVSLASTVPNTGINKVFVDALLAELGKSAPDFKVELFMDGALGGEKEIVEMLKLGETQLHLGVLHSALYYPELDATLVPYLFPDYEGIKRFLAGPVGERMSQALLQKGRAVYLGTYYQGARWTTSNKRFDTLEGLKGVKVRMPEIPLWIKIWGGMGAVISPIPAPEVYSALKTGVIDAQENMLSNILGRKIYEAQKFLIATTHQQAYVTVMASQAFWAKLGADRQRAVRAAVAAGAAAADAAAVKENERIVARLQELGLTLVQPRPEFRDKALPIIEAAARATLAPGVYEAALQAVRAK